ncbi:MAG: hypothetical protein R6V40_03155 [Candidatus Moraniibacteriota bacterium]
MYIFVTSKALAQFEKSTGGKETRTLDFAHYFNQATDVVLLLFAVVFIASLIGFIISGIYYLLAGGDEGSLESASKIWQSSLTGLFISLAGYVIMKLIQFLI